MFLVNCIGEGPWLQGCGDVCIPIEVAKITSVIYNAIRVIVPLALIFIGMFDMAKAVTTKSEEDVKKAQRLLAQKAIAGALVFVLFSAITWMISILDSTSGNANREKNVASCLNTLFGYEDSGLKEYTGTDPATPSGDGYTDPNGICQSNGYWGVLKITVPGQTGANSSYFVCADYNKYDSECPEGTLSNGEKFTFSNGAQYCVARDSNTNYAIVYNSEGQEDIYTHADCSYFNSKYATQEDCTRCCTVSSYQKGYLLAGGPNQYAKHYCICTNKK